MATPGAGRRDSETTAEGVCTSDSLRQPDGSRFPGAPVQVAGNASQLCNETERLCRGLCSCCHIRLDVGTSGGGCQLARCCGQHAVRCQGRCDGQPHGRASLQEERLGNLLEAPRRRRCVPSGGGRHFCGSHRGWRWRRWRHRSGGEACGGAHAGGRGHPVW